MSSSAAEGSPSVSENSKNSKQSSSGTGAEKDSPKIGAQAASIEESKDGLHHLHYHENKLRSGKLYTNKRSTMAIAATDTTLKAKKGLRRKT